jgi:predicted DNA-binding transcriptional regulator AlpA
MTVTDPVDLNRYGSGLLLSLDDVLEWLQMKRGSFYRWRNRGTAPLRSVRGGYLSEDVKAWQRGLRE